MREAGWAMAALVAALAVLAVSVIAVLAHRQFMQEQRRQSCYAKMLVVQQRQPWPEETFGKQLGHCDTGHYST